MNLSMSAQGQNAKSAVVGAMSANRLNSDVLKARDHFRHAPKADMHALLRAGIRLPGRPDWTAHPVLIAIAV